MSGKDERYVIDLCDFILGRTSLRHHTFDFLQGDTGKKGGCRKLPVDAYYDDLKLVIEYHEIQHFEPVSIMDSRPTCSDCDRGEQRKLYDQRRREVLPKHGIRLLESSYKMLKHDKRRRLICDTAEDREVIRELLRQFLPPPQNNQ